MTKLRDPLTIEFILSQVLPKLEDEEVKKSTGKSISHFRKCGDADDKDHNIHLADAIKLDVLLQKKKLGTPFLDHLNFKLEYELRKINEYENISVIIITILDGLIYIILSLLFFKYNSPSSIVFPLLCIKPEENSLMLLKFPR